MKLPVFLCFLLFVQVGCVQNECSVTEFHQYINDPDNGLIKTRTASGFQFSVKFLPPEYVAYNNIKSTGNYNQNDYDSLTMMFSKNLTFLLTIGPDKSVGNKFDIMYIGINTTEEYNQRVHQLNFDIKEYITIDVDGNKYKPVLTKLENTYGLSTERKINLVFAPYETENEFLKADEIDLIFNDEIFGTGINHFKFLSSEINSIPKITI